MSMSIQASDVIEHKYALEKHIVVSQHKLPFFVFHSGPYFKVKCKLVRK